jgi:hypothetical protein
MTNDIFFQLNQSDHAGTTSASRSEFESDILQQVRSEVQEAILLTVPKSWSREKCEAVEESVVAESRMILDALSTSELQSAGALRMHIGRAIAETKRLVHQGGVLREA